MVIAGVRIQVCGAELRRRVGPLCVGSGGAYSMLQDERRRSGKVERERGRGREGEGGGMSRRLGCCFDAGRRHRAAEDMASTRACHVYVDGTADIEAGQAEVAHSHEHVLRCARAV